MNEQQYLLLCLIEECAEVSHRATKMLRFGGGDIQAGQELDNAERLRHECADLEAIWQMLVAASVVRGLDQGMIDKKKARVRKYMDYSRERGTLEKSEIQKMMDEIHQDRRLAERKWTG